MPTDIPTEIAEFPVIKTIPIQWGDQDAFGHVNNTIPIRWFESARITYLEQSGLQDLLKQFQLGPILASITCHYRRQIHYPDTVLVGARITRIGRTSMTMAHAAYSQQQQAIVAEGDSVVVVFDYRANKPEPVNTEIRAAIEKTENRTGGIPE